ncbi:hypothetical protein QYE76_045608 [Lolium multiflorum]|uniref:Uncharacterized protein n=1 Tax=Lolium multiflorum TaxID=4521 RepID=A0AAD8TLC4_LOLMU|nr:hypothetical protein QYE76_045608 [Lolium multiflorum]
MDVFGLFPSDEDIPTEPLPPSLQDEDDIVVKFKFNEVRYEDKESIARGGGEQLDMVLDMKTSHGHTRGEREACAKEGEEEVQAGATIGDTDRHAGQSGATPGATGPHAGKYESLRNEMRREFPEYGEGLNEDIQKVTKKLDATNETVNIIQEQMTDVPRNLQALTLAIDNLTQQRQQSHHEDEESNHDNFDEEPAAEERGVGRGACGRGFVPFGAARRVPPQPQDDGLGK